MGYACKHGTLGYVSVYIPYIQPLFVHEENFKTNKLVGSCTKLKDTNATKNKEDAIKRKKHSDKRFNSVKLSQ